MAYFNAHAKELMKKINLPLQAAEEFSRVLNRLDSDGTFSRAVAAQVREYMSPSPTELEERLKAVDAIASEYGENSYTLQMVFLIICSEELHRRYSDRGISDEIFYASMDDMRCKNKECMDCKGVCGTFVGSWYGGFFEMRRFALGRFQYEDTVFTNEGSYITKSGYEIKEDDRLYNFHIPSSGISLSDEVRLDSYKRAYEFFKCDLDGKPLVLCCNSWLLYPEHRSFLPENSNILRFMDDFEIIRFSESDTFRNDWRVFDADTEKPLEKWREDTSLRRAYKNRLLSGGKTGSGFGVIVFDGERILK